MELRGAFRDRLSRPGRAPVESSWRPNLVLWSALDLIGSLLCNRSQGVAFLAVGAGDPSGTRSRRRRTRAAPRLTAEVHRVRLVPGETLSYDPATGRLHAHVSIGPGQGDGHAARAWARRRRASPRPGSGTLVNHAVHAAAREGRGRHARARHRAHARRRASIRGRASSSAVSSRASRGSPGLTHIALGTGTTVPADGRACSRTRPTGRGSTRTVSRTSRRAHGRGERDLRRSPRARPTSARRGSSAAPRPTPWTPASSSRATRRRDRPHASRSASSSGSGSCSWSRRASPCRSSSAGSSAGDDRARLGRPGARRRVARGDGGEPGRHVLEQTPAEKTLVNEGTPVALVVATPPTVVVPEVVGAPEEQARRCSRRSGSRPSRVEQQSPQPPGTVLVGVAGARDAGSEGQRRRAHRGGARARRDAGPARPHARGGGGRARRDRARAAPEPYPTQESSSSYGTIVAQTPDPEAETAVGTAVAITLATP